MGLIVPRRCSFAKYREARTRPKPDFAKTDGAVEALDRLTAMPRTQIPNGGLNHSLSAFVVRGQPFSAQQVAKTGKTLQDGTNIEHFGHHAIYRDYEGRVRVEQPCGCAPGHEQKVEIYVMDPVAGTMTTWRQGGDDPKVDRVTKWQAKTPESVEQQHSAVKQTRPPAGNGVRPQPLSTVSEEPMQELGNVPVRMVKVTTVVPAGRNGNDRPITKTHTAWISDDLKMVMMEQWQDPRAALRTVGLGGVCPQGAGPGAVSSSAGLHSEDGWR